MTRTCRGGRPVVAMIAPLILTTQDVEDKLERASHTALTTLGEIMGSGPPDTRVQAAGVIL